MEKINKIATESFKSIFNIILEESASKIRESGFDPNTKEGKALVSSLYKKVLLKMGIDLSQYHTEEFKMFWEKNRVELEFDFKSELSKALKGLEEVKQKRVDWNEINNTPALVLETKYRSDYGNIADSIEALSNSVDFTRDEFKEKISSKISHNDLRGVGPDDHHPEKHTLESHLDSRLMQDIKELLENPSVNNAPVRYVQRRSFTQLNDTPSSFSGQAGKSLTVKSDETGLEFSTAGSGDALTTSPLSQFAATTSAQLAGVISDETGSGALVFANTPTLVTPVLGVATGTSLQLSGLTASQIMATDASKNLVSLAVATYPSLTELSYVKGVTSAIQTQINAKAPSTAPTFATSITGSYLTASEILITDGSKNIVSAAVATYPSLAELTYLKGVTSAIQTQLDGKQASGTYVTSVTGTTNRITSSGGTTPAIDISASYVGQSSITTLGTVTTGTWNASIIVGTYGGTGVNNGTKTLTYLKNISLTAADDTGVYTLPTGTKTLLATDGAGTALTGIPYTLTGTANQVVLSAGTGNITFSLPQSIGTASNPQFATIELGAASDTTLARVSAGVVSIEGVNIVTTSSTDTLTNKTLTSPVINTGTIGTSLVPTSNDGAALGSTANQFSDLFLAEGGVINFDNGDATITQTGNDITIAGITTFGVGTSTAVTLGTIELGAASDTTIARVSAGVVSIEGVNIVTVSSTDTLTNKTLTAPKFASAGFIADANGNELIIFTTTASAVNEWTLANGATGVNPKLTASGETNVGLDFQVKGTGTYRFLATASGPTDLRLFEDTDNGTNYVSLIAPASMASDFVLTLPGATDTLVGKATTDVFTNKTLIATTNVVEEITTTASSATPTPTGGSLRNFFTVTAQAAAAAFAAPSGTPANGNYLTIRILDNGTARALTWNAIYRAGTTVSLPTTTVLSKTIYIGFRYNSASSTWDLLSVADGF